MSFLLRLTKFFAALLIVAQITGCAHSPNDPLEGYNRQAFYFNEALDTVVVKPIAYGYHDLVPDVIQTMVGNFFGNIADVWIAFNNFLQGRGDDGFSDVSRVIINTFAGLGGVIDVASEMGLPKHNEDFGQTLGVWGAPPGPYFVIPILGPSNIRDTLAAPADYWFGDPWSYINNDKILYGGIILRGINTRAELIDASSVIDDAAIDKYEFVRDAFVQRRQRLVHDKDLSDDQWETLDAKEKSKAAKEAIMENQIWLPSSENKPATETEAKAEIAPMENSAQAAVEETVADSASENNKPAQAAGPVSSETASLIN